MACNSTALLFSAFPLARALTIFTGPWNNPWLMLAIAGAFTQHYVVLNWKAGFALLKRSHQSRHKLSLHETSLTEEGHFRSRSYFPRPKAFTTGLEKDPPTILPHHRHRGDYEALDPLSLPHIPQSLSHPRSSSAPVLARVRPFLHALC